MKKWIIIVSVLVCCCLYALVKLSKPQGQNEIEQSENPPVEAQADVGNADKAPLKENSGSAVPADQVEAVTKVFKEFQGYLKDGKYEQAWELTTEHFKSEAVHGGFEGFKETCVQMEMATVTIHPESVTYIDGNVALLITGPSLRSNLYFSFVEEDGQWKLNEGHNP